MKTGGTTQSIRWLFIFMLIQWFFIILIGQTVQDVYGLMKNYYQDPSNYHEKMEYYIRELKNHRHRYHDGMAIGKDGKGLADGKY